jgi:Raf kinase inhibitor-like YbhB/YbcL family protein
MILESKDFNNNQFLDKKFTCDGEDFSPHLIWRDPPKGTKSFALSVFRVDPNLGEITHWRIYNIPLEIHEIEEDGAILGIQVENDFHTLNYEGPNAAVGVQKYIFRIYALDSENLNGLNNQNFKNIIRQHTIEFADLIGFYERKTPVKSNSSCNANGPCGPYGFEI